MTRPRPKSWGEVNQRKVVERTIEWDGAATAETINLPLTARPLNIAIDNEGLEVGLNLTLAHKIRIDPAQVTAVVGTGANSFYTVTVDAPGKQGEAYAIKHVLPAEPEEATEVVAALVGQVIIVTLAVKADNDTFVPDDAKNTAVLIAAEVNKLDGFTAVADGNGSGVFDQAAGPINFAGGTVDVWAPLYDALGAEVTLAVADDQAKVFGPFKYFPRFYGGRLVLTATGDPTPPVDKSTTTVTVVEG